MIKVKLHYDQIFEGMLVNEKHALFADGNTVFMVKVGKTEDPEVYIEETKALMPTIAENIKIINKEKLFIDIKKMLEIPLFDYLTKICDNKNEFNLGLVPEGESEVKKY
ncbi:hypothetical protein ACQCT5_04790 [Sutcliffiella halmapala]